MTPYPVLLGLVGVALSAGGFGGVLVARTRARATGWLLLVSAALLTGVAFSLAGGHTETADLLWHMTTLAVVGVTLSYPRIDWRDWTLYAVALAAVAVLPWALPLKELATSQGDTVGLGIGFAVGLRAAWRAATRSADRWPLGVLAVSISATGMVFSILVQDDTGTRDAVALCVAVALVPPALYLGTVPQERLDVRGVVVRAVVVVVLAGGAIALYAVIQGVLTLLGDRQPGGPELAVVGLGIGALLHPGYLVLRGVVDTMIFGGRPVPLSAATRLSGGMGTDPAHALEAIREALYLPYAALLRADGTPVVETGASGTRTHAFPLDEEGVLVVGTRAGDVTLTSGDRQVLGIAVPLLAQTLRAHRLTTQVQHAREELVTALEEERRRLRRDLHDGLGPQLSGIAFTADAIGNSLGVPERAQAMVAELRRQAGTAIDDVRRLVYDMRPPALDELGLVGAILQASAPLRLQVEVTGNPGPLPAAVEVAAYRIVVEALANAARHSGGSVAAVAIDRTRETLSLTVDDGGGSQAGWRPGVGISSMRERAAELGGSLSAANGRVTANLPL